uniref:Transcription elongation factor 1 homolog n=1 Tax=Piliocolobus tephrosceles TaxID=591936 RepID=A0A8C9HIY5_9PRIM
MGRRKSKRKPPPKKKMTGTLETQFTCPFCNHEKSCDVKMDRARNTGVISCTVCLEEFQTPITCILRNLGFFQRMGRRLESGPCSSDPLCALVQGQGRPEEQVPPTDLCGVRRCRAGFQCQ